MQKDVIGLDRKLIIIAAILFLIIVAAAVVLLLGTPGSAPAVVGKDEIRPPLQQPSNATDWVSYLGEKGLLMENSSNVSASAPKEVAPGITYMVLKESFTVASDEGPVVLVKTSDVYLNKDTGQAVITGYYVTTADAEKERWDILTEQLEPDGSGYSGE